MRLPAGALAVAALGAVCGTVVAAVVGRAGPLPVLLLAASGAVGVLLRHPAVALAAAVGTAAVLEGDPQGFLPQTSAFYTRAGPLPPSDYLVVVAVGACALDLLRRRRAPAVPRALAVPLVLLVAAAASGAVTGLLAGGDGARLLDELTGLAYLALLPVVTATVLHSTGALRSAVLAGAGIAVYKGLEGSFAQLLGTGRTVGAVHLTYYEPSSNWLMLVLLLGVVAALALRVPVPRPLLVACPFVLLSFVLSFRRSFWIAFVLAAVVVFVVASGRRGWFVSLLVVAGLALSVWTVLAAGGATQSSNPVAQRAASLSPRQVQSRAEDRYRLDEQRNVLAEIRRAPLTGVGLGVPWSARSPLPEEHEGGRYYVHSTLLWFWLKLGLLGALAYLALQAAVLRAAWRLYRGSALPAVRCVALALAGGFLALALAELTGAFTGVGERFTTVVAPVVGLVAAADERRRSELHT